MFKSIAKLAIAASVSLGALAYAADNNQDNADKVIQSLGWVKSGEGAIANKAAIKIPEGYAFLNDQDTSKLLELYGNLPEHDNYLIAPKSLDWFAVFSFKDTGYVKDDEKINADELLASMQAADKPANEQRQKLGLSALYTDGWQVPPHYDSATKRLEWGLRLRDASGAQVINYTSRILGRSGVMTATLVADPESLAQNTEDFKKVLSGFQYNSGQSYAEFKQGDKVAAIGLGALVLGGAAAVATKKGFWAAIAGFLAAGWKLIAVAVAAVVAAFGKLFGRKKEAS